MSPDPLRAGGVWGQDHPGGGHYFTERNEQFRQIILRNGTGSNAHTTAKIVACALKCASY